jgi:hypothetical protein
MPEVEAVRVKLLLPNVAGLFAGVLTVRIVVPDPCSVVALNVVATPVGAPETEKLTSWLKPFNEPSETT